MNFEVDDILNKNEFSKDDLVVLLSEKGKDSALIFNKAAEIKAQYIGNKVYFRGLIEFSNLCSKNCFYCGIRNGNENTQRYTLSDDEVLEAARYAFENRFASIVIQSGERADKAFTNKITALLEKIKKMSDGLLGITLSLGEQTEDTYREWFNAGAHRYLLRIETSNKKLYKKLHPENKHHSFNKRIACLESLKKLNYQVGSGVMVGLPFQSIEHLAEDLLFLKNFDIDMVGLGPYIEHEHTPLFQFRNSLLSKSERFDLSLKMIALLRIMMKDINIAATTAMQAIDPVGREKALKVGANIIMPNLTPLKYRNSYQLYKDKPCMDEEASECKNCLEARIKLSGDVIGYGEWGDSKHFITKNR